MSELVDDRFALQLATLIISISSLLLLSWMVYRDVLPWRYAFLPLAILIQRILFYGHVVVARPAPSASLTFWSSVISFEIAAGFFIVLWSVYRGMSSHD